MRRPISRRGNEALSTLATQPSPELNWKQEVNQRLAAHRSRRDGAAGHDAADNAPRGAGSRAAQAAARVALKAQAVAESVLAGLESRADEEEMRAPRSTTLPSPLFDQNQTQQKSSVTFFDPFLEVERPVTQAAAPSAPTELEIRWEQELPVRTAEPARVPAQQEPGNFSFMDQDWRRPGSANGEPETVEPAQPIHANLIEFPRELIAARRARPRIAEGPLGIESQSAGQLSIFEVDPGTISIEPQPAGTYAEPAASGWSRLRLDAEQMPQSFAEPAPAVQTHAIHLAPVTLRALAAVVDFAWVCAAFAATALLAAANLDSRPSMKIMELVAVAALFAIGVLYHGLFFAVARSTPGMRYAGIGLCTFSDENPTPQQLQRRVGAVILSLLPVGLGLLWAIFDEDHLTWHDRLSHTYQRCL
jgi:uncharacterized RDD family membrane protein YckC